MITWKTSTKCCRDSRNMDSGSNRRNVHSSHTQWSIWGTASIKKASVHYHARSKLLQMLLTRPMSKNCAHSSVWSITTENLSKIWQHSGQQEVGMDCTQSFQAQSRGTNTLQPRTTPMHRLMELFPMYFLMEVRNQYPLHPAHSLQVKKITHSSRRKHYHSHLGWRNFTNTCMAGNSLW